MTPQKLTFSIVLPRKRQYVHRFLHVWGLKKYKQNIAPRSAPSLPTLDMPSLEYDEEQKARQGVLHHEPPVPRFAPDDMPPPPEQGPVAYPLVLLDPDLEQPPPWATRSFLDADRYEM